MKLALIDVNLADMYQVDRYQTPTELSIGSVCDAHKEEDAPRAEQKC